MAASVTSPADVVNIALRRIGYQLRVGHLYDGSKAANNALDIYAQTRDEILRGYDWGFAEKIDAAALTGNIAPSSWSVEYVYPNGCLKLRNLFNATYTNDRNNPKPTLWQIGNALIAGAPTRVIWTNITAAVIVYTLQVTNPIMWDADFVEALAAALARRLPALLRSAEFIKLAAEDEKVSAQTAEGVIG